MCPVHRYIFCRSHQVTLDSRSHQNYVVGTFDQAARRPARRSTTTYLSSTTHCNPNHNFAIRKNATTTRAPHHRGNHRRASAQLWRWPARLCRPPHPPSHPTSGRCLIPEAQTRAVESDCPEASSAAGVRPAAAAARSTVPAAPFFKPSHQQPPT